MSISMINFGQQSTTDGLKLVNNIARNPNTPAITKPSADEAPAPVVTEKPKLENIKAEVEKIQAEFSSQIGRKVVFSVNSDLDQVVIKIVDPATDKVIKEIPSEDIQKLKIMLEKTSVMIVDEMI